MIKLELEVPMVPSDPSPNGMPTCPMQTYPYLQEAYNFDIKLGQHCANAGEGTSNKVQEGHQCGILSKCTETMTDVSSIVAILFEHTMEVL
jgi:hypothetical protein